MQIYFKKSTFRQFYSEAMDRGCISYCICFLIGLFAGELLPLPFYISAIISAVLLLSIILFKKNSCIFVVLAHMAIFSLGTGSCSLSKTGKDTPYTAIFSYISEKADICRDKTAKYFKKFCSSEENCSTLCALSIGTKGMMEKELKSAYSKAGAMHLLALSGLHIGIIYFILCIYLSPMLLIPHGRVLRDITSLVLIFLYSILCGCSPSVIRASIMILIYKIGVNCFRNVSKWETLAISALATGVLAPLQIKSISFQLSYSAIIGISLLFPTCKSALHQVFPKINKLHPMARMPLVKLWENIAISVCCQIGTLPVIMYYFGYISNYYLITNLIAIPLATMVLYVFSLLLSLQWISFPSDILYDVMNYIIELLNSSIKFISG